MSVKYIVLLFCFYPYNNHIPTKYSFIVLTYFMLYIITYFFSFCQDIIKKKELYDERTVNYKKEKAERGRWI